MAYSYAGDQIGAQPITTTSTVQRHPLGSIRKAIDPILGEGEFIYLLGVASTVAGLAVTYNATTSQTTLMTASQKLSGADIAIAMSANVAAQYGWYQISGMAVVLKTATKFTPAAVDKTSNVYISATAGRVMSTSTNGQQILKARGANLATVTTTTSTVTLQLDRPFMQGLIS